jgi:adenine/guanine phosphoribosyltransferase-like PRPP-binding protein
VHFEASSNCSVLRTFQGVAFCDIFPLFRDPLIFEGLITHLTHRLVSDTIANSPNRKIDVIVALDARGFLLGPVIALRLGAAFVPVRKRGKLPGECVCATFEKEYGTVRGISSTFALCIAIFCFVWLRCAAIKGFWLTDSDLRCG